MMEFRPGRCWIFNERFYMYAALKPAKGPRIERYHK